MLEILGMIAFVIVILGIGSIPILMIYTLILGLEAGTKVMSDSKQENKK